MRTYIKTRLLPLVSVMTFTSAAWAIVDSNTGESTEIKYQAAAITDLAWPLAKKVEQLESPVEIYEYVRNNYDFALYHGARSGSINTFMGMRGNDVDLAATLIAMMRAKGYPARYAVGTVRLSSAKVANWLAVGNTDLAAGLLHSQGIQGVAIVGDTISFEHVWAEVLVPYGNYRGAGPSAINCATTPASCTWVSLDPSFKQHVYSASSIDPYRGKINGNIVTTGGLQFNYDAYYDAVKNSDTTRLNKNPLEIYQNQIQTWLQTNAPGKTLADIPDFGDIIAEEDELLPASLPYTVVGSVRRYNSVADHDDAEQSPGTVISATEPKNWVKYVTVTPMFGTGENLVAVPSGAFKIDLVTASTQRLTYSAFTSGSALVQAFRLNGAIQTYGSVPINGASINGVSVVAGAAVVLRVSMDGVPSSGYGSVDEPIKADYRGTIGGYYLVATGGETSNWTQVHRASDALLKANQTYKIVFNTAEAGCIIATGSGCTPYVAPAGTSAYTPGLPKLANSPQALDDLTGGLLAVGANQYYASLRDSLSMLDGLNKIKTPIDGFLGVVSASDQVEYIDGTAFSIQPGGLLIDMKGIKVGGCWRIDAPGENSDTHFELGGHILSSLEHETWQKLTGYDAISTVRGFQLSRSNGATFTKPKKSSTVDTIATMYADFGYSSTAATGFTKNTYNLWNNNYISWSSAAAGAQFVAFRSNVAGLDADADFAKYYICGADTCGFDATLKAYRDARDAYTVAQTAAATPDSFPSTVQSSTYATYNVIGTEWLGASNFSITGFSRVSSDTYSYNIAESVAHADGVYSINFNALVSEQNGGGFLGSLSGLTGYTITNITSPTHPGILIYPYGKAVGNPDLLNFYVSVYQHSSANVGNGTIAPTLRFTYNYGGLVGTFDRTLSAFRVYNGYIVSPQSITGSYQISNNGSFTCPENNVAYNNQTPTQLLAALQSCFSLYKANHIDYFNFFTQGATDLQMRAVPAGNDAPRTANVMGLRNDLYWQEDMSNTWLEYQVPIKLSTTQNMRFAVNLRRERFTSSGQYRSLAFQISNEWTSTASGGFVRPPLRPTGAMSSSEIAQCDNFQGAPLKCQP